MASKNNENKNLGNLSQLTNELSESGPGIGDTGVNLKNSSVLIENSLLTGNDGTTFDKNKASKDFILRESSLTPESSKRKREDSPDTDVVLVDEEDEEDIESGAESDVEDNPSDIERDVSPSAPPVDDSTNEKLLPETVTVLTTPHGAKVYLVGTAHFSLESQEDVARVIQAVQPHVVLVELCQSRVNILQLDEETILEEAKNINFEKIRSTIKQNGFFHGAMYILLLNMSAHLTKQLGMAPGGEFRRAFAEAKKVPSCVVHLGDRPIQITLKRALSSLSWWQTLTLTWYLIMSKEPISKEEVERCKRRDLLEQMLAEMAGEFPALGTVFVNERDIYLTHSLQMAAAPMAQSGSSLTPARVVGVVGIGHVPGIVQNWGKVTQADIPPIMHVPLPSRTTLVIKFTLKASIVCLTVWGLSKIVRRLPGVDALKGTIQALLKQGPGNV